MKIERNQLFHAKNPNLIYEKYGRIKSNFITNRISFRSAAAVIGVYVNVSMQSTVYIALGIISDCIIFQVYTSIFHAHYTIQTHKHTMYSTSETAYDADVVLL